jgi:transcriptional regulator with XRE-family HTH domain
MHIALMDSDFDIKTLREARNWTQDQMAAHFGVNKATIWRWENNGVPSRGASRMALEREYLLLKQEALASSGEAA